MNFTGPLFELARREPQAEAVICTDGTLSRAELARAVASTAARLAREGLAPGDRAAIQLSSQLQILVTSLALARIGVEQLCLQASDSPALAEKIALRAKVGAVIAAGRIEPPPASLRDLRKLPAEEAPADAGGARTYSLIPTSGTTADAPKLVVLTHQQALRRTYQYAEAGDAPGTRLISMTSLSFVGGMRSSISALYGGGAIAITDGIDSVERLVDFVARGRISTLIGTAVHADRMLKSARPGTMLLPGLRVLRMASSVVPDALRARILAGLSPNLHVLYGTTEGGPMTSATPDMVRRIPGVVGRPLQGVELRLADEGGREVPAGTRGQVWMRSGGMASGYLDDPEETARRFRDGWFLPGDLAELTAAGELVHHGRSDDTMIFQGLNVLPVEIESALQRHPAVAEAAAFAIRSQAHGDVPVAAVVPSGEPNEAELLRYCRAELGARAPQRVFFVRELPRTSGGKLLRNEMARLAIAFLESRAGATPRTPQPPPRSKG